MKNIIIANSELYSIIFHGDYTTENSVYFENLLIENCTLVTYDDN